MAGRLPGFVRRRFRDSGGGSAGAFSHRCFTGSDREQRPARPIDGAGHPREGPSVPEELTP